MSVRTGLASRTLFAAPVLSVVCLGYWAIANHGSVEPRRVRIGFNIAPPYFVAGKSGGPDGFVFELMEAAAKRANVRLEWVLSKRTRDNSLQSGELDLWPLLASTPARRR
ncbi:MAG: transporter substrate-binding domain-containing protein [Acidobacteria bacterium]|nr:transporter substrate-binding domain-containing protein [Acidobacteriota bacterium]